MLSGIARAIGRKLLVPQFCCSRHPFKALFADSVLHHCSMSSLLQPDALTEAGFTVYPGLPLSLDKTFKKKAVPPVRAVNVANDLEPMISSRTAQGATRETRYPLATQQPCSFRKSCVESNVSIYGRSV